MNKKKKILVITFSFPTKINPVAAIFILNQLEYLKKDYDIKVLSPYPYIPSIKFLNSYYKFSNVPFKEKINGIEVYRPKYPRLPRNKLTFAFINVILAVESFFSLIASKSTLAHLAKKWNFDIIHVHGLVPDGIIALKCKKMYNKPIVVTLHGEDVKKYSKMLLLISISKYILKKCDRVICVSKSLKDEIYNTNLSKKQIEVIPSGYNIRRFKILDTSKCRKILNLPKNKDIILFVGGLVERKGVEHLIRALKILDEKNKEFICCLVGSGTLERKLKSMVAELEMDDKVIFAGQKAPDEIALWMNACDVLVLPSLDEGLPNVLSEAMACGKPVVAANVAGIPEIVNKDVGYLVKPKDADDLADKIIVTLNKNWDKKKLLKRASEFSVTNSVKKIKKIYVNMTR